MRNDFAVIIISHGRPDCITWHVLRNAGYTGKMIIVVDDEDSTKDVYIERYGPSVHVFHKRVGFDIGDNQDGPNGVATFARNECWNVAEKEGLKYFLMLDDDLQSVSIRHKKDGHLKNTKVKDFDAIAEAYCNMMDESGIDCTSFGLAADYIGGLQRFLDTRYKRWTCCTFFLRTASRFDFVGRYSEDAVTPILNSQRGKKFVGFLDVQMVFDVYLPSRPNKVVTGGCQDAYRENDSYILRYYGVMFCPDCIKVRSSRGIGWDNTINNNSAWPKILSPEVRKDG